MKVFNKHWMDNLRPGLLYRYWLKKGGDTVLHTRTEFGTQVSHFRSAFGVLSVAGDVSRMRGLGSAPMQNRSRMGVGNIPRPGPSDLGPRGGHFG